MIDLDAIGLLIADAVELATGITVIIANQDAPRPTEAYATVHVTPSNKVGFDRVTYGNDTGSDLDETIEGHRLLKASLNFYKKGAANNASTFKTKLQGSEQTSFFKVNGLGFVNANEIKDLSEIVKNLWEERVQFDLSFHALSNFPETVTAIEEANIEGVTESGDNTNDVLINVK